MAEQPKDFKINTAVNAILASHRIDTSRVNAASTSGMVYITGIIARLGEGWESVSPQLMAVIDSEIKAVEGVEWIHYYLENMIQDGSKWHHIRGYQSRFDKTGRKEQKQAEESEGSKRVEISREQFATKKLQFATVKLARQALDEKQLTKGATETRRGEMQKIEGEVRYFSVTEFMKRTVRTLREIQPEFAIAAYFNKTCQRLESEIIGNKVEDEHYDLVLYLLKEYLKTSDANPEMNFWDTLLQRSPYEILRQRSPYEILRQNPCKTLNFFFRFLSVFLYYLKEKFSREQRVQIATMMIQSFTSNQFCCIQNSQKICELEPIFEHYRKHALKTKVFCPGEESPKPSELSKPPE